LSFISLFGASNNMECACCPFYCCIRDGTPLRAQNWILLEGHACLMILSLAVPLPQDGNPTERGEKTHRPRSHERAANTAEEQLLLVINSQRLPESKGGYTCRPAVLHSYHLGGTSSLVSGWMDAARLCSVKIILEKALDGMDTKCVSF